MFTLLTGGYGRCGLHHPARRRAAPRRHRLKALSDAAEISRDAREHGSDRR